MSELDRRSFLKIAGASAGAAATVGCSDIPQKLIPYVVQPEEITPGIAVTYASTCRECPAACGLHVTTREARPVKLEGNPDHPINQGALCARGQASIGRTYSPDRHKGPMRRGAGGELEPISWDEAIALLAEKVGEKPGGTFVLGSDPGPSASALIDRWVSAVGAGGRIVYEPFESEALLAATRQVFGVEGQPVFDLAAADLIIDFGSDFLENGLSPTEQARGLAEARDVSKHSDGGARFVYVGPRLSMTGSNADEWIAAKPGTEGILALAIARAAVDAGASSPAAIGGLLSKFDAQSASKRTGVDAATITRLGQAVARAKAPLALPPSVALSGRRAVNSAAAALILNYVGGGVGTTLRIAPSLGRNRTASYRDALRLVDSMNAGEVSVLIVHDANPAYSMPKSTGFGEALAKVPFVVSLASATDETSEHAHLVLPDHTPLESWGDAEPRRGVRSLVQPTLRPLYDTRALGDTLLDTARKLGRAGSLPSGSFRGYLESEWAGSDFNKALARGGEFKQTPLQTPLLAAGAAKLNIAEPSLEGDGEYVLLAFPSPLLGDGSGASLPWLQEIPDPVTKVSWQSHAEISKATAEKLGVETGEIISIETPAGMLDVPAYPRGGIRDDVVALAIGQGHTAGYFASMADEGQPGEARGVNVMDLLPKATDEAGGRGWLTAKASLKKTGGYRKLPLNQFTDNKRERMLGQSISLAALASGEVGTAYPEPHGAHGERPDPHIHKPFDAADDSFKDGNAEAGKDWEANQHRWGMAVDLDRCTGCSACVAACYIENNIPVVGETQVAWGRTMSWLRIERYAGDGEVELGVGRPLHVNGEELGNSDIRHSPMLCQQCGAAPCEPVCPVFATYHNPEGLNGMIYNRCIGTRYCSNNCSYKVRRYNWYDYQRPAMGDRTAWPEPMRLMLNPDVTVRGQGVMEKCTFCIQRIQTARQPAKDEGRAIADGEVLTACQQSCPTGAISFGNLQDNASQVSRKADDPVRGYRALHDLNTRPAITYLAQVSRGEAKG